MGTRSTIKFVEKYNDIEHEIVNIYQQYDGYIEGVGYDLANWLSNKTIINGIGFEMTMDEYANGTGCLAAQFIKTFKTEIGGLYIVPLDNVQEYNYRVVVDEVKEKISISVTCDRDNNPIFIGSPKELLKFKE